MSRRRVDWLGELLLIITLVALGMALCWVAGRAG